MLGSKLVKIKVCSNKMVTEIVKEIWPAAGQKNEGVYWAM